MSKFDFEEFRFLLTISVTIGIALIVLAVMILPENCFLFDSNKPGPQMCHTIPMPEGCQTLCADTSAAFSASMVAGTGIGFFFIPFLILGLKSLRKSSDQMHKLLD